MAFGILGLQSRGFRPLEILIAALVGIIVLAFSFEVVLARPVLEGVLGGLFTPASRTLRQRLHPVGILGATVMPYVTYLHSALTQRRIVGQGEAERIRIFHFEQVDVVIAIDHCRRHQHGDADHGRRGVPRQRLRERR